MKYGSMAVSAMLLALPIAAPAVVVNFSFAAVVSGDPAYAFNRTSVAAALPTGTTVAGSLRFDAPFSTTASHSVTGSVQIGTNSYAVGEARSSSGTIVNGQLFDVVDFQLLGALVPSSNPDYQAGSITLTIPGIPDPDPLAFPVPLDLNAYLGVSFADNNHGSYFNDVPLTVRSAELIAAVPEPATWAAMAAGLGLVGWAGRGRRPGTPSRAVQ